MIVFTGDICLCDRTFDIGFGVGSLISGGRLSPFQSLDKKNDDLWIGNFEGVVSDLTCRKDYTKDSFRIKKDVFRKCSSIIDYWGIANNHVMGHGPEAYLEMEYILNNESKGAFGSANHRSIIFDYQNKTIAITGFNLRHEETKHTPYYWHQPELSEISTEFNKISEVDIRIAYIHWGVEYVDHPSVSQIKFAHWLIDLGYDLIIGMHPHVLQGYEIYKEKYIFYSLGNFVFNMPYEPSTYGAIVLYDIQKNIVDYRYIHINKTYSPEFVEEENVPKRYRFEYLNSLIGDYKNIEKYIKEFDSGLKAYRKSNNREIILSMYKYSPTVLGEMLLSFIKRKL